MLRSALLVASLFRADSLSIGANDNTRSAGRLSGTSLSVSLDMVLATWPVYGPGHAPGTILAFAESGKAPTIPGPMLRVKLGTRVTATIRNRWSKPLVVHGLSTRRVAVMDTLAIPAGGQATTTFAADAEGTFFYWAAEPGVDIAGREYLDSQLSGAFIVDASAPPAGERVLVLGSWTQAKNTDGTPDDLTEVMTINGRAWPGTERMTFDLGDSVRWRVINPSRQVHPMHLHGFFFRLNALGDHQKDTTYWPREQRLLVTQRMDPGSTMRISFQPDRAGGWLWHCHLNWHVVSNAGIGPDRRPSRQVRADLVGGQGSHHDPARHIEHGMGGLLIAFRVRAPVKPVETEGRRHLFRLLVQSNGKTADSARYGFVLQDGDRAPVADSIRVPGSPIVLTRGEPTLIRVVNRTAYPTQVHWHGLELESPFDGVIGVGGFDGMPTPPVMPGDSFDVRVTPPRAGSYMYHTHVMEIHQQSRGMWGPLVVAEPDQPWNPARDLIFMAGEGTTGSTLNGRPPGSTLDTLYLKPATEYRLRLMNVTMGGPYLEFWLSRGGVPMRWTSVARDGADLPSWQRETTPARRGVGIGETHDVTVTFSQPGDYALELRRRNGTVHTRQPISVSPVFEVSRQVAAAVLPLPAELRDGATVLGYRDGRTLSEIRKGSNGTTCLADDPQAPAFHVACYQDAMEPFMARGRALRESGVKGEAVDSVRYSEIADGKLPLPRGASALWQLSGPAGSWDPVTNVVSGGRSLYVIYLPFATEASTGLPVIPQDAGRPWLMSPGTPKAHIMLVPSMGSTPVVP
jgi:FtsP/CotA-like multicopper oxidase with cupredoxin domain